MKSEMQIPNDIVSKVKSFLREELSNKNIEFFICNITRRQELNLALLNGSVFTKAPRQNTGMTDISLQVRTPDSKAVSLSVIGNDFSSFLTNYRVALDLSVVLPNKTQLKKHGRYPKLDLASEELTRLFSESSPIAKLEEILGYLDSKASEVTHPNLMSREVGCSVTHSERSYFDSAFNEAVEDSFSTALSCSFSLSDSSEYFSDYLGVLPGKSECEQVVAEASKNITRAQVRPLGESNGIAVVLTPPALVTLLSDLVLPNLGVRSILDGTGAWDLSHLGKKVLEGVTLHDNPHLKYSPFSSSFDIEGTPSETVQIMKDGVLTHPLFTNMLLEELRSKDAELANKFRLTGHADSVMSASPTNLFVELKGEQKGSMQELLRANKTVVVVNWLTGMSVDPLTGQFALDSEGAKVYENGELLFSTSLTLRGNFFEALAHPENKVSKQERFYNTHCPALFTKGLSCVSKELANGDD